MYLPKIGKIITMVFSIAFITSLIITLTLYFELNSILHTAPSYLLIRDYFTFSGITTLALLFPFLLSIAYVMVVIAEHTLEKGIERLREEELKCPNVTEPTLGQKEPRR